MVVLVMGVSGSGKSTVGAALAEELGWGFVEGDAYHPPENIAKMSRGEALDDADRWPWLRALRGEVERRVRGGEHAVLACSALKAAYRRLLRDGHEGRMPVVYLRADVPTLRGRVAVRRGGPSGGRAHFMPASLLESQLAALEPPRGEEGVLEVDASLPVEEIVRAVRGWLGV